MSNLDDQLKVAQIKNLRHKEIIDIIQTIAFLLTLIGGLITFFLINRPQAKSSRENINERIRVELKKQQNFNRKNSGGELKKKSNVGNVGVEMNQETSTRNREKLSQLSKEDLVETILTQQEEIEKLKISRDLDSKI